MLDPDTSRLSRLTALLTSLQAKRIVTAPELARQFQVSVRTVYRDIRALEAAGVPICTEEGRGYSLVAGYRLPPVTLSEREANALVTAEKFVLGDKDASFVAAYRDAITKIKSVLGDGTRDKAELLSQRTNVRLNPQGDRSSDLLMTVQAALTAYRLLRIDYLGLQDEAHSQREIEPFALYATQGNWCLIAFCRLRQDFRVFRLDRIQALQVLAETFPPHPMTLEDYYAACREKYLAEHHLPLT